MAVKKLRSVLLAGLAAFCASLSMAAPSEPIRIGLVAELTGTNVETGGYQVNGVKLALEEINAAGGVLGRPLELQIEDSQSTNPGSVAALTKIIDKGRIAAVIGPVRSTQTLALMPTILKAGIPSIVGATEYTLTHANNPWLLRARPHNGYSAKVLADFGVNTLKRKKWAIVYTAEALGIGGKNQLIEALKPLGITPILVQPVNQLAQDYAPAVLAIKNAEPDIIATYMTNAPALGTLAVQVHEAGVNSIWVGSPTLASVPAVRQGGRALYDSYSVDDFAPESSPEARAYTAKYKQKFGIEPDFWSSWAYDALHLIALAIKSANSTQPEAIRKAILSIQGYRGAEGTYHFDRNGDGLHGYNVIKNEQGRIVFIKHVSFEQE
jgi:branched-chain amino acid transport system substrate-binding protein